MRKTLFGWMIAFSVLRFFGRSVSRIRRCVAYCDKCEFGENPSFLITRIFTCLKSIHGI